MTHLEDGLAPRDHRRVAAFIEKTVGIQLPEHKRALIETRLRKRVRETGHDSLGHYLDFALSAEGRVSEQPLLIDAITTNKTDFFREPVHFQFLVHHVRQTLAPRADIGWRSPLRVWSAACSTGEEPYTLAMVLLELQQSLPGFHFEIDATDIAPSVLVTAQRATYPEDRIEPIPMPLRRRYLLRSRSSTRRLVRFTPEVRRCVRFYPFNLINDAYPDTPEYDIIFCRNVMIYFNNEDRQRIIGQMRTSLHDGGLLFIGHSESIGNQRHDFETLVPTVYRRTAD